MFSSTVLEKRAVCATVVRRSTFIISPNSIFIVAKCWKRILDPFGLHVPFAAELELDVQFFCFLQDIIVGRPSDAMKFEHLFPEAEQLFKFSN